MRCRGRHEFANGPYLRGFLFCVLRCVAPYCVPGGVRVASMAPDDRGSCEIQCTRRTSARSTVPSDQRTPSSTISLNIPPPTRCPRRGGNPSDVLAGCRSHPSSPPLWASLVDGLRQTVYGWG